MLALEEEEVAALEWDVSEAAAAVVVVVAAAAAIVNLAAVDPGTAHFQ